MYLSVVVVIVIVVIAVRRVTMAVVVIGVVGIYGGSFVRRGGDHQLERLLRGRQLRDVVLGVGAADMLLHRAVLLLLCGAVVSVCHTVRIEVSPWPDGDVVGVRREGPCVAVVAATIEGGGGGGGGRGRRECYLRRDIASDTRTSPGCAADTPLHSHQWPRRRTER